MDSLFSYFSSNQMLAVVLSAAIALAIGLIFAFVVSRKFRGTKGFFITAAIMPIIISSIISLMGVYLTGTSTEAARIVTIAVALGLIRFRSSNGSAEEMLILFSSVAIGLVCGLGYVAFAAILMVVVAGFYLLLDSVKFFENKKFRGDQLLKITIPESLEYSEVFSETFDHYCKSYSLVEVKTTGMGSLFRLSYKIQLKNTKEEKEFIDELRTKNGNLEISVLPYTGEMKAL